ncbi:hypothetical protein EAO74_22565 [Streptomyces sp. gb1(2016)]|uniref:Uncharacterized protein n=1 Tax=Streptomyces sp. gb1(2016) TaxID=1828321 RepID=A0A652KI76_9ACTN|nr:hypothetical protein EAO74_22565 [Streptomyces sp. gb1(2016)]
MVISDRAARPEVSSSPRTCSPSWANWGFSESFLTPSSIRALGSSVLPEATARRPSASFPCFVLPMTYPAASAAARVTLVVVSIAVRLTLAMGDGRA